MQVAIPHQLGKEEARRRLRTNSHRMGEAIPGGMTQVETTWPSEDRMVLAITAMGQSLNAHIYIEDALPISDRVAMLDKGRIRFVGTPDEFRESEDQLVRAFLERDAMIGTPNMLEAV